MNPSPSADAARFEKSAPLKQKSIRSFGVILAVLLLTMLAFHLVLHLGWNTYTDLDQIPSIDVDGEGGAWGSIFIIATFIIAMLVGC